jgi:hypothetical protein
MVCRLTMPQDVEKLCRWSLSSSMHMTRRWLIAFLIATFGGKLPSPDTPASVIDYFQKFNKPLPEQFCAKEDAAPKPLSNLSQSFLRHVAF